MVSPLTPSARPEGSIYDWTTPQGLEQLRAIARPSLRYEPRDFQVLDSARILNGQDVFCITATGDGKSGLIYLPALARKEMITVVVEPTNYLEVDLVSIARYCSYYVG